MTNTMFSRRGTQLIKTGEKAFVPVFGVFVAFAVCSVVVLIAGKSPLDAYRALLQGAFGDIYALATTGVRMTPILIAGLGVGIAFRAKLFNVGGEGQIYMGGVAATIVGLAPWSLPAWLHIPLALLAGLAAGALWVLLPAVVRAYRGVNELVTTLMLNYVAILLVQYLVSSPDGPMYEKGAPFTYSPEIAESARLPELVAGTSLHGGLILGLLLAVAVWILMEYTPFGFRTRMLGHSVTASSYVGVRPARQILKVMLISGAICGLAGAVEVIGLKFRLYTGFSPGFGYDAMAVALMAHSNGLWTIVTAGFFGALRAGGDVMQQKTGIAIDLVYIVQAVVVLFVVANARPWRVFRAGRRARGLESSRHDAGLAEAEKVGEEQWIPDS